MGRHQRPALIGRHEKYERLEDGHDHRQAGNLRQDEGPLILCHGAGPEREGIWGNSLAVSARLLPTLAMEMVRASVQLGILSIRAGDTNIPGHQPNANQ